jgi:hypothetical protein
VLNNDQEDEELKLVPMWEKALNAFPSCCEQ